MICQIRLVFIPATAFALYMCIISSMAYVPLRPSFLVRNSPILQKFRKTSHFTRCGVRTHIVPCFANEDDFREPLIIGLNKYSHDASCAILSGRTGELLFMTEKERISRKKHASGDVADLVDHALDSINCTLSDVKLVVQQNHHWRIAPFEERLPWAVALAHYPITYLEETSLFPNLQPHQKHEMSHHLAHAWSVFPQAPFDNGLIVVMDGMGEQFGAMATALRRGDKGYSHDLSIEKHESFVQIPEVLDPWQGYREAESAYLFNGQSLQLVFKRYSRERSPPELYNHGFENMESLGAVYSRISSHIFGDWNTCGKVMGLASYGRQQQEEEVEEIPHFMEGSLASGTFQINWEALEELKYANEWMEEDKEKTSYYANVAWRIQKDLEDVALDWIQWLQKKTGAENLCLCGGVAQNSVLNGRISRELGFKDVFIPPYPGDEGISVGCAFYGFASGLTNMNRESQRRSQPLSPYQGKLYDEEEMEAQALQPLKPFIHVERLESMEDIVDITAKAIHDGQVAAWFQGRSECGPRALGHRSILADPRRPSMNPFLNKVKGREAFRPFAPSVLAEDVADWFEVGASNPAYEVKSPYMSITLPVKAHKRAQVPAICHVDGTARLQTVREEDNPWYYRLIQVFKRLSGVPFCLNTSFNIKGEPIVETPEGAIRSFLSTGGGIDILIMGHHVVRRRGFALDTQEQGFDPSLSIIQRMDNIFLEETIVDSQSGRASRVRIAEGSLDGTPTWIELEDELDLILLNSIDSLSPVQDVIERVLADFSEDGVQEKDAIDSLRRLYNKQLIYFV